MQRQTVTVLAVEKRQSQSGKAFWRVRTDAGTYFAWDAALAEQLTPGTTAVVSINGSSDYPKIVAVHEAPEPPSETTSTPAASELSQRDRLICKQVALKAAVELAGPGSSADQVLTTAETFYAWLASA